MTPELRPRPGLAGSMLKPMILLAAALTALPLSARAQQAPDPEVVDRVLAVVGDSVVLHSQIEEDIQRMRLGGAPAPEPTDPEYAAFFNEVLQTAMNRVLILQAAAQDTLIRPDAVGIERQVSGRIDELVSSFGGRPALQQALEAEGLTLAEYRDVLTTQARQEQIQQMYLQSQLRDARPVDVSEDEMRARFENASAQLQQRPRLLTFRQVVIVPDASEEARE